MGFISISGGGGSGICRDEKLSRNRNKWNDGFQTLMP